MNEQRNFQPLQQSQRQHLILANYSFAPFSTYNNWRAYNIKMTKGQDNGSYFYSLTESSLDTNSDHVPISVNMEQDTFLKPIYNPQLCGLKLSTVQSLGYISMNIIFSVGVVMTNKWVFDKEKFKFGTLITVIHFIATFIGLKICTFYGIFKVKPIRLRDIIAISTCFSAFVVLTNLSLQFNSVGFYQVNFY